MAHKRRRAFVAGQDRVGGYYGRYSGRPGDELKFHDVDNDTVPTAAGAVVATVNIIPQGITEKTRIGRKCTIRSINWRYVITLSESDAAATPARGDNCRIVMFVDKQCNGATAANTDIFESANYQSFRNLANSGRFTILHDKNYTLNRVNMASDGAGLVSSAAVEREGTFFKQCNIPIEFNAAAGAIGEIRSNNIGTIFFARFALCTFESKIRLRFSDN